MLMILLSCENLPDDITCNLAVYADDTSLLSRCDRASDLWQYLGLASEYESGQQDTVNCRTENSLLIPMLGRISLFHLFIQITVRTLI